MTPQFLDWYERTVAEADRKAFAEAETGPEALGIEVLVREVKFIAAAAWNASATHHKAGSSKTSSVDNEVKA